MSRDNFTLAVKRTLAERAAYFCSNPKCLRLTTGPRSNSERELKTGHAAHICAAAPGGARYDVNQTAAERRSIANGIWLCRECGDMVDKGHEDFSMQRLHEWKENHEIMIGEVRQKGWANSIELLRSSQMSPNLARGIVALIEDRRLFWARFDAEFPERVRTSLNSLRVELNRLRCDCHPGSPIDNIIVALSATIRHFFVSVERIDLTVLRCDSGDPDWRAFELALATLRKSVGFQIAKIAELYSIRIDGEFAAYLPSQILASSSRSP